MGKRTTRTMCVLVVGLLAGCVAEGGDPVTEVAEPEVPAFHFASGTLELGDFNPDTLGDDLFDPCTEISAEEYAAAGITGVEPEPAISSGVAEGCRTDQPEPALTRTVIASRTTAQDAADAPEYEFARADSEVEGIYTFKNPVADPYLCVAQVDTVRGGLAIGIGVSGVKKERIDPCQRAVDELSRLFSSSNNDGSVASEDTTV